MEGQRGQGAEEPGWSGRSTQGPPRGGGRPWAGSITGDRRVEEQCRREKRRFNQANMMAKERRRSPGEG